MNIEELKLILLYKSLGELETALNDFDITSVDKNGSNILHYYIITDASIPMPVENVIQLFVNFGINVDLKQSKMSKRTALQIATLKKSKDAFDLLLKNGANVNIQDGDGNVALSHAVWGYRGDDGYFIETLISNGANVDTKNNYDVSPKELAETIANYDTKKFFN